MVFFLNGYGPRHIGIVPRESHISFVLDGGLPKGPSFVASSPTRVVVAVESNLDLTGQDIQSFLKVPHYGLAGYRSTRELMPL